MDLTITAAWIGSTDWTKPMTCDEERFDIRDAFNEYPLVEED